MKNKKTTIIILLVIFFILSFMVSYYLKVYENSFLKINLPNKIPNGFTRRSIEKRLPPDIAWMFIVKYENDKSQQIIYKIEPQRAFICEGNYWKEGRLEFKPIGSSDGCSMYQGDMNNLQKNSVKKLLHWFVWNKDNVTYNIFDPESILTNKEAMDMADSISQQTIIAKIITTNK